MNRRKLIKNSIGALTASIVTPVIGQITAEEITEESVKALFRKHGFHVTSNNMSSPVALLDISDIYILKQEDIQTRSKLIEPFRSNNLKAIEAGVISGTTIQEIDKTIKDIRSCAAFDIPDQIPIFAFYKLIKPGDLIKVYPIFQELTPNDIEKMKYDIDYYESLIKYKPSEDYKIIGYISYYE